MSEPIRAGAPVEAIEVLEKWFGDKGEEGRKFYGSVAAEILAIGDSTLSISEEMIAAGVSVVEEYEGCPITPSLLVAWVCRAVLLAQQPSSIRTILPEVYHAFGDTR